MYKKDGYIYFDGTESADEVAPWIGKEASFRDTDMSTWHEAIFHEYKNQKSHRFHSKTFNWNYMRKGHNNEKHNRRVHNNPLR